MSLLKQIDKFIHKRVLHSSVDNDSEFIETDETRKINNVVAAPPPSPPPSPPLAPDENNKEAKQ